MKRISTLIAGFTLVVATATVVEAATFEVDKTKSRITVKAKATGGGFTGTLKDYKATISGNATTLKPSSAKLTWLFKNLDTKKTTPFLPPPLRSKGGFRALPPKANS